MGNSKLSDRVTTLETSLETAKDEIGRLRKTTHTMTNEVTKLVLAEHRNDKFEGWIIKLKESIGTMSTQIAVHDVKIYAAMFIISIVVSLVVSSVIKSIF